MMPLQVLIDATVVQVNLTDKLKYGISWYFKSWERVQLVDANTPPGTAQAAATAANAAAASQQADLALSTAQER